MNDVPPSSPALITFRILSRRRRLPVALRSEPVPVRHQPLGGDAGQLCQAVQILERVGERLEASCLRAARAGRPRSSPRPEATPGARRPRGAPARRRAPVRTRRRAGRRPSRRPRRRVGQLADAVAVHRDPEPELGLDLVALGDRDLAHVVAEARDRETLRIVPAACRPRPGADPAGDGRVAPVADDRLAPQLHPRLDEAELPVAVRRLVQVHEVHVDVRPRQVAVELRMQVEERLLQGGEAGDPHPRRRERVHPRHEPDAGRRCVRLEAEPADRLGARQHRLVHDPDRHGFGGVERGGHLP